MGAALNRGAPRLALEGGLDRGALRVRHVGRGTVLDVLLEARGLTALGTRDWTRRCRLHRMLVLQVAGAVRPVREPGTVLGPGAALLALELVLHGLLPGALHVGAAVRPARVPGVDLERRCNYTILYYTILCYTKKVRHRGMA